MFYAVHCKSISWFSCLTILVALCGCSGKSQEAVTEEGNSFERLQDIERAYRAAIEKAGQPPKSREELVPFLPKETDKDAVFRSARDQQPFVIVWGTDIGQTKRWVIAYEKSGKDGSRIVWTVLGVMQMTDAEFANASFPPGHTVQ